MARAKAVKEIKELTPEEIVAGIQSKYEDAIVSIGNDEKLKMRRFSTFIPSLDNILGGGIPFGRNLLVYGDSSAGKTWVCQKIIEAAQKQNLSTAFIDVERTFDQAWFQHSGISLEKLVIVQPTHGDQAINIATDMIKAKVSVVVLDSVAALIPATMLEETSEEKRIGELARLFNNGLRKITAANHHGESVFIAINQPRAGIGGYIPTEALPAGKGQWFFSSIILRIGRGAFVKEKEDGKDVKKGFVMKISTEKNKTAAPYQTCELTFNYADGAIDYIAGAVEVAMDLKIIDQRGPWFYWHEEKVSGKEGMQNFFRANLEMFEKLKEEIKSK